VSDTIRTKHALIYDHIRRQIESGRFPPGSRIPTESELCDQFDVSRMTVSRALRELVNEGLLLRRHGAGTFVHEHPEPVQRMYGLLFGDDPAFPSVFYSMLTHRIARRAREEHCGIMIGNTMETGDEDIRKHARTLCEQYIARGVHGVFFLPLEVAGELMGINEEIVRLFERAGVAVVLVDKDIYDFPRRSNYDLIGIDNVRGGFLLTDHLLQHGYRRIKFVTVPNTAGTISGRIAGYRLALLEHGIQPLPEWVLHADVNSPAYMDTLLNNPRPDAIVCKNDHVAAIIMQHLAARGIQVPADIAIVGFDDASFAPLLSSPLTTIHQPVHQIADLAIDLMDHRLQDRESSAREIRLNCQLIVRQSCGTKHNAANKVRADNEIAPIPIHD
jgi:LacI family transcriptional regulator